MTILPLVIAPHSRLREKLTAKKGFGPPMYRTLDILKENMIHHAAVGLAANQVGFESRTCVIRMSGSSTLEFVNPVIVKKSGRVYSVEGCLSIPNYIAIIPRSAEVKVTYDNRDGKSSLMSLEGDLAIRIQHEIDHLDGILIKDYVTGENGKSGGLTKESGKVE